MQTLNGLGDKTKDFIDFPHQDGACHDRRTQGLRGYNQKHESQHKSEDRASHPKVQEVKEKWEQKGSSVQKKMQPRKW